MRPVMNDIRRRLTWKRVRLKGTALQGIVAMLYEGPDETLYWMRWDEGFDGTYYRVDDLERGDRGEPQDSRLYTSSDAPDRQAQELERLKNTEEGLGDPFRRT